MGNDQPIALCLKIVLAGVEDYGDDKAQRSLGRALTTTIHQT